MQSNQNSKVVMFGNTIVKIRIKVTTVIGIRQLCRSAYGKE